MEFSFDEALLYCLNQQDPESGYWNGHYYGLVSVGQLRHFRNRYDFGPSVDRHQHYFDEQRMFRYVHTILLRAKNYEIDCSSKSPLLVMVVVF